MVAIAVGIVDGRGQETEEGKGQDLMGDADKFLVLVNFIFIV